MLETITASAAKTWSGLFPVHPAADAFPMMSDDELDKLAQDIKTNGLRNSSVLWQNNAAPPRSRFQHNQEQRGRIDLSADYYVLDGRNRLAALDRAEIPVPIDWRGCMVGGDDYGRSTSAFERVCAFEWFDRGDGWQRRPDVDPVAFVLSLNVHRRHLTKQQQADLVIKTVQAGQEFLANLARKSAEEAEAARAGRPKDRIKEKAVEEGEKQGISRRTIERALGRQEDRPKAPRKPKLELAPRVEPPRATAPPLPTLTYEEQLEASVEYARHEVERVETVLKDWRRSDAKYCSAACRQSAYRKRKEDR